MFGCKLTNSSSYDLANGGKIAAAKDYQGLVEDLTQKFDCDKNNFGIYWLGRDNLAQKFVLGQKNDFFSNERPTVIYIHGWQKDAHKNRLRENFLFTDPTTGVSQDLAQSWIEKGWNIGIFYWTQFADEEQVTDAEAKIWASESSVQTWKACDAQSVKDGGPKGSVAELFVQNYADAMRDFKGKNIRIIGHSLGSQVAARSVSLILKGIAEKRLSDNIRPTRVAQLDPYWTDLGEGKPRRGKDVKDIVDKTSAAGLLWEVYMTSNLLQFGGDQNLALMNSIGYTRYVPDFIVNSENPLIQEGMRHVWAPKLYFLSIAERDPKGVALTSDIFDGRSAATSDEQIDFMMRKAVIQEQVKGKLTPTTKDDKFRQIKSIFN